MKDQERQERIRQLEAEVQRLTQQLAAAPRDHLAVPADELPADYKGSLYRRVEVSLRPELRRRVVSLHQFLRQTHATIRHPRYHDQTRHVDDLSHVMVWLLERVKLTGSSKQL